MEIKEFFDSNFSNILKDQSCPDHETAFKDVKERAKRMKNKESNVRQIQFKEVPVDYTEPKKSAKALHAVAGVAGAAAVLTGAVFGLNWLNEHGGLKEGGIGSSNGAGYHEDVTAPAQSAAEPTNALIAAEDIRYDTETPENVFEFDGVRAIVDWWQFDGKTLKLQYDIDLGTNKCEDIGNDISHRITPIGNFEASTTLEIFEQKENSVKMRATIELFHYADIVSLNFIDNDEYVRMKQGEIEMMSPDAYRELEISLIDFKKLAVHYTYSKDTDAFDDMEVYGCHRGKTYITHDAVSFEFSDITDVSVFDGIKLVIVDFDNNETPLGEGTLTLDESGTSGLLKFPTNGIDFDIGDIYAYRLQRPDETSAAATMSKAKTEVPAIFDLRTSGVTITVNSYEFDGKTLNMNWDDEFDRELEQCYNPENRIPLVNGMKNMDAFSFMGEPDENIKNVFVSTNSISDRTINHTITVELESFAESVDLIFPPSVRDEFDVPEYTFTATVNTENVQPALNENTGKNIYSYVIERFEPVTVAPEENRNYLTDAHVDTDECSIDMNWLTFDGITLRLQYDVTFRNGLPTDGSIPIIVAYGDNEIRYTTHGTRVDKLGVDGNKVSYIGEVVYNRIMSGEPIKLRFRHFTREGEKELISWLDTEAGVGIITPDELPDAIIVEYEVNKDIAMKWGSKATVEKATLCRDSVMFTLDYRHSDLHNHGFNLHETYLVMNDGSKVDLESIEDQGGTEYSGSPTDPSPDDTRTIWQHYELSEPIDPSAVAQIYVCGECIYDAQETLPKETAE